LFEVMDWILWLDLIDCCLDLSLSVVDNSLHTTYIILY
jgi:hypothetical protein